LFGDKDYEIITDGLKEDELSEPSIVTENVPISIYFSGLLHIDYYPLFQVLAEALDILSSQGNQFKIILRGTQKLSFLEKRNFLVEYLPFTLDNEVLKGELDNAAILYLPIKFTVSDFYQFSLSTKMVGYLGGAGVILYHGPSESAACLMLEEYNAAITCTVNDRDRMVDALKAALSTESVSISQHAKKLARQQFLIDNIQTRFWQNESVVIV
jgi:hypothetical protein